MGSVNGIFPHGPQVYLTPALTPHSFGIREGQRCQQTGARGTVNKWGTLSEARAVARRLPQAGSQTTP